MAQGDTPITIVGNVVADPELRYTSSGVAVSNFRIASTPRTFNKQSNQWEDAETLFLTVNVWREMAENVMESIQKSARVMVTGVLRQRSYDTKDGQRRTVFEVEADEVGPSLRFATAQVQRNQKGNGQQRQQSAQQQGGFGASSAGSAYQPQQNTAGNGGFGGSDEPPW